MRLPITYGAADQSLIRKLNTSLILECLRICNPLSRAQLADRTGLNRSTVSNVTDQLLQDGLIREIGPAASSKGRPGILLELNPDGGCALGMEIGVGFISIIVTDFTAQIMWRQRVDFDTENEPDTVIKWAEDLTRQALDVISIHGSRPLGIGIGVPGRIDHKEGTVLYAGNLNWRNVPIRQIWAERFGLSVFVENADNAAALGEYYFDSIDHTDHAQNLVFLNISIGFGGGIVINGTLLRGRNGNAGEIGHMVMVPDGELCSCGKRGCLQTLVNSRVIVHRMQEVLGNKAEGELHMLAASKLGRLDAEMIVQAAEEGDPVARMVLEETGTHLGLGISSIVNALNPALVVLGGAFSLAGPFLLGVIDRTVREHAIPESYQVLRIATSSHGPDACVMGAVALVLDEFLREPIL